MTDTVRTETAHFKGSVIAQQSEEQDQDVAVVESKIDPSETAGADEENKELDTQGMKQTNSEMQFFH